MIDNEIIKSLDSADVFLRGRANSTTAPLNEYDIEALLDIANICDDAASIINRLNAQVEKLNEQERILICQLAEEREKAIKEFAERLKKSAFACDVSFGYGREHCEEAVTVLEIDSLVREMTEETP